jgi:hypothetical protein
MKTRRRNRRQKKSRRGGKYYAYNRTPKLFTNTTSQLFGGDARSTLLPQPLANAIRNLQDSNTNWMNAWGGKYPSPSSNVLSQPINKIKT